MGRFLGILCAVLLHLGFILFGGLLFPRATEAKDKVQDVELLAAEETPEEEQQPDPPEEEVLEAEPEEVPDATEILKDLERSPLADAPALDAASLSAIELALSGQSGSGDFSDSLSFQSGSLSGTGTGVGLDEKIENALDLSEIDQAPRAIVQPAPSYPAELRKKKLEGVVTLIFVVDAAGKVTQPRVQKSTHAAFDKPALDAIKQWRFEPAVKAGQRVACKMRLPIRFQPM